MAAASSSPVLLPGGPAPAVTATAMTTDDGQGLAFLKAHVLSLMKEKEEIEKGIKEFTPLAEIGEALIDKQGFPRGALGPSRVKAWAHADGPSATYHICGEMQRKGRGRQNAIYILYIITYF